MTREDSQFSILFVCLGNICRSPAAQGVFEHKAAARGLSFQLDSAGTGGWHAGDLPDARMRAAALTRGYDLSGQRARQVDVGDFYTFDLILAMDASNRADLEELRPPNASAVLEMMLTPTGAGDVPDPYYGAEDGFAHVLDLLEAATEGWLDRLNAGGSSDG